MHISCLSKRNIRYNLYNSFSNSRYSLFNLLSHPKTLVFLKPHPYQFIDSKIFHSKTLVPLAFVRHVSCLSSHCYGCHRNMRPASKFSFGLSSVSYPAHTILKSSISSILIGEISKYSMLNPTCALVRRFSKWSLGVSTYDNLGGDNLKFYASPKQISEIIELIRDSGDDLESMLNAVNVRLSLKSALEIFRVLNFEKVPALGFFNWIRTCQPEFYLNSDVCNLIIDNCGRLNDLVSMHDLLKDFNLHRVCLTQQAFGFLPVMISSEASMKESISEVINVLNEVKGSCHSSGIFAMIELLSILGSIEMAKYVLRSTEKKISYYNIIIREMCRRCDFEGARDFLNEMRLMGCHPNAQSYNYIVSNLCKNDKPTEVCKVMEEMQEMSCPPNPLTFEILIHYFCRIGNFDLALEYLDRMSQKCIPPRLTTHAAFIKGYFDLQQYEAAYKYVVCSSEKYKQSSNMMYSLLASLHQKKGNFVIAQHILLELIGKGLRPQFSVYMRVLKDLQKFGNKDLAIMLSKSFTSLSVQSSTGC